MRLVLDTNILISAIVFSGKPKEILDLIRNEKHSLVMSDEILGELSNVLVRDFQYGPFQTSVLIFSLAEICQMVKIDNKLKIIQADPDDNIILETAINGKVEVIITVDKHLLNLKSYQNIPIITASEFLEFELK